MRNIWTVIVLIASSFAASAAQSPGAPTTNDNQASETSSELRSAVLHDNIPNDPTAKAAGLSYDTHMSDCENRWVALYHRPDDADYTYGFVYIDPQAGFTLHYFGRFTIDADHNFRPAPNPMPPDKYSLKIRLEGNGVAALLPARALEQLHLPQQPDWLKFYEDPADPITHKINWGFFYNAIGDSARAVEFLEPAYRDKPDAPRVVFELAFAYNALGRFKDAIRVSKDEFLKKPKDEMLCREIAYAHLQINEYKESAEQYQSCIALCDESEAGKAEKSELAMNLSSAYAHLGDTQSRDAWREKAKTWAPKGSAVYKYFHPNEE